MQNLAESERNQADSNAEPRVKPKQIVHVEMLYITTQDIARLVKTVTSPSQHQYQYQYRTNQL